MKNLQVCCFVILEKYFDKHIGLATGVVTTGSALAYIIFPIVWQSLLHSSPDVVTGIRRTMIFIALTYAALIINVILWASPKSKSPDPNEQLYQIAYHKSSQHMGPIQIDPNSSSNTCSDGSSELCKTRKSKHNFIFISLFKKRNYIILLVCFGLISFGVGTPDLYSTKMVYILKYTIQHKIS